MNEIKITSSSITINGREAIVMAWERDTTTGIYTALIAMKGKVCKIQFKPGEPYYNGAARAYNGEDEQPTEEAAQQEEQPAEEAAQEEEQPAEEEAAADPEQPAVRPVPEKAWINETIHGIGWHIEFDGLVHMKTRLIFDKVPSKETRELVKGAGWYWNGATQSWNKKLTWKAYRAAQQIAGELGKINVYAGAKW